MFLPFSQRAKDWEPHALKLRALVPGQGGQARFDPLELAPKVGLRVVPVSFQGLSSDELRHLQTQGRSHCRAVSILNLCQTGHLYAC